MKNITVAKYCLILSRADDGQNVDEDVYNIQVKVKCSEDILLRGGGVLMLSTHHELSVVNQVYGEQQGTQRSVHEGDDRILGDKNRDQTWKQVNEW